MSDLHTQRDIARRLEQTQVGERPSLRPAYAQRVLNPVASAQAIGDFAQPWAIVLQVFTVSVFIVTTNNATNFWTIELRDATNATLCSVTTAAVAANAWARLTTTTIIQPAASNPILTVVVTPTLAPGNIYVVPQITLLKTGN
jgi:hypothetical protein